MIFEPETVKKASELPGVIGLKDSSGNMVYFHQLQQLFKDQDDFKLFVGPEELLGETLVLGGHGGVCGCANLIPELHERIMQVSSSIYSVGKYKSSL